MSAHYFTTGSRFEWQQMLFVVDRAFPQEGKVNLENLHTGAFITETIEHLMAEFFEARLRFVVGPEASKHKPKEMDLSDYAPDLADIAQQRYEVIGPLRKLRPAERTKAVIAKRIAEVKATWPQNAATKKLLHSLSRRSIFRWLARLEAHNGDIRALIPRTDLRGAPGKSRLHPSVDVIIHQTIIELYKRREKTTINDLRLEIAVKLEDENKVRQTADQLSLPSHYAIIKRVEALDLLERYALKHGPREARRAVTQYGKMPRPKLPFEVVMLDSTRPDIIILDSDDLPVGSLFMTYGLDFATGYPAGFYLGFEPGGYFPMLECAYHIVTPKGDVQAQYKTEHSWLACGVPSRFVVDNGNEFDNRHLQDSCLAIGAEIIYAPVRTPEFKASIERFFRTQNDGLLHTLDGTTFSNILERGDYNSDKQACLYLADLMQLMHIFALDVYAESPHKGVGGIPARRWEAAMQSGFMPRLPASAKDLLILLGRVDHRTLWHYGVEFEHLHYNSPELGLLRLRLKEEAKHKQGDMTVKIKYHPGDISRIHVLNPFAKDSEPQYIEVPACDPEGYTHENNLWKHRIICRQARRTGDKVNLTSLGRAKRRIREVIQLAHKHKRKVARAALARWEETAPSLEGTETAESATPPAIPPKSLPIAALPAPALAAPPPAPLENPRPADDDQWEITQDLPTSRSTPLTLKDTNHA